MHSFIRTEVIYHELLHAIDPKGNDFSIANKFKGVNPDINENEYLTSPTEIDQFISSIALVIVERLNKKGISLKDLNDPNNPKESIRKINSLVNLLPEPLRAYRKRYLSLLYYYERNFSNIH